MTQKRAFQQYVHNLRQQKVSESALSVFTEKGCFEFKVEDVAAVAGVAKGCIYNHFRSKAVLLSAALEEYEMRVLAEFERRFRDLPEETNPVPKLKLIAEVLLAQDGSDKAFVAVSSRLPCALASMGQGAGQRRVEELIVSLIEAGGSAVLPTPGLSSTALAELFVGIVVSRPVREKARSAGVSPAAQSAVNFFLRGAGLEDFK